MYLWQNFFDTPNPDSLAALPEMKYVPRQWVQNWINQKRQRQGFDAQNNLTDQHRQNLLSFRRQLIKALAARGIKPVDVREYKQAWDEPRVVALGTEIEKIDPTVMFFIGRAPSLELVWQPFREASKDIRVYGADMVESTAIYANAAGRYTGLRYVRYIDPRSKDARMTDLNDRYWMWISRGEMTNEAVMIYDALTLVGEAMRAGARTRPEFITYFASLGSARPPFKGVGGLVEFSENGESKREMHWAEVTYRGVVMAGDSLSTMEPPDSLETTQ
jgi:hypothetical protein